MILPSDLIIKILLKLPVKSLIRFKCVCKSWLCFISDPHFAISHFELNAAKERIVMFAAPEPPRAPRFRSIDINASLHDDSDSAEFQQVQFLGPDPLTCFQIIGSCRGLLLLDLRFEPSSDFCVWNPSTGVHKFIHYSPFASSLGSDVELSFTRTVCGFGYDSSTDDYLVFLASNKCNDRVTCVDYFSLRANAWKEVEATHLSHRKNSCYNENGLLLNGAIHWLAFSYNTSMDVIVAFDLTEKSFSEIPLPVDFIYNDFEICYLRVVGELLGLCAQGWNYLVEIWAMKEYKVQCSWTKMVVVVPDDDIHEYFIPICATKSGNILGTDGASGLVKFNEEGQLREHRSYCIDEVAFYTDWALYTESLLPFPSYNQ